MEISYIFAHSNNHAGAAPAQIGVKTGPAEFTRFHVLTRLERHTTKHGIENNTQLICCKVGFVSA